MEEGSNGEKIILLVDDQEQVRSLTAEMLREADANYTIHQASTAPEGLDAFKEHKPDLVITDIIMPGPSGQDLIREIRTLSSSAKILSMTGKGGFRDDSEANAVAKSMMADAMIQKPFQVRDLLEKVEYLLVD